MRYIWNKLYQTLYYFGVYCKFWPGPKRYMLSELGLDSKHFNQAIAKIALDLQQHNYEAYIVGGALRDLLCDATIKPKDFDIVTSALPQQVKRCFSRSRVIGKRFKIVHVPVVKDIVEVSTFRGKSSWLSRWRGARYQNNIYGSLEQDVWRRDFTANALYYNVKTSEVVDFVGGVEHIKAKKLVMIGDCAKRFKEDPVRILRALRFTAKTGFEISDTMKKEIQKKKVLLQQVSKDRLLLELVKLFSHGHCKKSMQLLQDFHCLSILFPGFGRMPLNFNRIQPFWDRAFANIDHHYRQKKRLSSSFLFAILLWPIFETQKKKIKRINIFQYKKLVNRVLRFESRYIAIPKKLQEAIKELWLLQYTFETKTTPFGPDRVRQARFHYAYELLMIRAKSDERLAEKALMWQPKRENHS